MKTLTIIILSALVASCVPVAIVVEGQHGTYGYSSKSGLTATIHAEK